MISGVLWRLWGWYNSVAQTKQSRDHLSTNTRCGTQNGRWSQYVVNKPFFAKNRGVPAIGAVHAPGDGNPSFCMWELIHFREIAGFRLWFYYLAKRENDFTILEGREYDITIWIMFISHFLFGGYWFVRNTKLAKRMPIYFSQSNTHNCDIIVVSIC